MKKTFTILIAAIAAILMMTQPMTVMGQAAVGTTLWAETWTGGTANQAPATYLSSQGHTGTTVYGNATISYTINANTNTKLYTSNIASGAPSGSPELLLAKKSGNNNGVWTISGIPTGGASVVTFTFYTNKNNACALSTSTSNVTVGSKTYNSTTKLVTCDISIGEAVSSFDITFTNSTTGDNARVDDLQIVVKTAGGGGGGDSYSVNIANNIVGGTVVANPTSGEEDDEITLTATPTENSGYYFNNVVDNWSVTYGNNQTCTVTPGANNTATFSMPASSVTVSATFTPYTVTLNPGSGTVGTTTWNVTMNNGNLPAATSPSDEWSFGGWSTTQVTVSTTTSPTFVATAYKPTNNVTLYAVYVKTEVGNAFDGETGGDYLIYANTGGNNPNHYAKGPVSSSALTGTTSVSEATTFTFTKTSNNNVTPVTFTIKIKGETNYIGGAGGGGLTSQQDAHTWTVSEGSGASWRLTSETSSRGFIYRASTYNTFKNYATVNVNGTEYYDLEIVSAVTHYHSTPAETVEAPQFNPVAGTYNENQSVEISCGTAGATIYYTTDGGTPTSSSTQYTGAITVDRNMTIKAIAIKGNMDNTAEAAYVLTPLAPTFDPAGGAYSGTQHITIDCETAGVTLSYKLGDGEWTAYVNPVEVSATATLYAKATKANWTDRESSASYTITPVLSNIAALTANTEDGQYLVTLNNAVVTYVNGYNAYIQDASGAVLLYKKSHGYTAGDVLNGTATVTYQLRYGNPQITDISGVNKTSGTAPNPTSVAQSAWNYTFSDVLAQYFQITGAEITKTTNNDKDYYWVLLNNQSIQLYAAVTGVLNGLDLTKKYTITGFPTLYVKNENTTLELNVFVAPVEEPDTEAPSWETLPSPIIYVGSSYDITLTDYVTGHPTPTITLTSAIDGNNVTISSSLYEYEDGLLMFQPATAGTYNFTFNASNTEGNASATLTIMATTPAAGSWVLTPFASLTPADVFVIVGTNDLGETYYAMSSEAASSTALAAVEVSVQGTTLSGTINQNIQWNLSGDVTTGCVFHPVGSATTWLYNTGSDAKCKVNSSNTNKVYIYDNNYGYLKNISLETPKYIGIYNSTDWRGYVLSDNQIANNIAGQTFSFYKLVSDDITRTTTVSGCGDAAGNYHLIASPVASVTPTTENGFIRTDDYYDLYYFNQSEENEWRNYKQNEFNLVSGKGYLYANKTQTTLTFTGKPYNGNGVVALSYDGDAEFAGWNLIGNPFAEEATVSSPYYKMNTGGTELEATTEATAVAAMQGIFVKATTTGQSVTFSTGEKRSNDTKVVLNVIGNDGNVIDRTIVCFNEGRALPKFMLDESNTKIYIPQTDTDYAIVSSDGHGTMPVNFKAKEMGRYTISIEIEGIEMSNLHLTDRLMGENVDLLRDKKYSFIASNSDIESRFILSFTEKGYNADNETFAFQNGNDIIVKGEGELQIFDVMGRNIMNTTINGVQTVNVKSQGVYIFKLNEKTQKIIVR